MRICMLVRNPFTRDARVLREARGLAAAGHEVTVLAVRAGNVPAREERDGFVVLRSVEAGRFSGPTIMGAASNSGKSGGRFRPTAAVIARDVVLSRRLTRAAAAIPADVYHAHDLNTLEAASAAARAHEARLVYDAHELYPDLTGLSAWERARWRRIERALIGRTDAVIVPSPSRGDVLVERYSIPTPAVVMNCPPGSSAPDPSAGLLATLRRRGETLVVYAGGFTPNRGLENVVRAFDRLPGCRLAMVGWGPLASNLQDLASSSMDGRVVFPPAVDPDEVVGEIAGADIGLAPYLPIGLNNVLAAPNKLFEYLHAGLAVAASDLPDVRVIMERHHVGTLFDASDPSSIADAIGSLRSSEKELAAVRARARAAANTYTWEKQLEVLTDVYEHLSRPR
jgi:glycosyltransferase involved in cell wall biosynthesis